MAKRKSRIAVIEHEVRQLEKLKELEPNTTPPGSRDLSDALVDIAISAMEEVLLLEAGKEPEMNRLHTLAEMVSTLPTKIPV